MAGKDDAGLPGKTVRRRSPLTEEAYQGIKDEILENRMAPGFQATEPEVAERLGMSRTPVREALIRLQEDGLVEVVPRRGMRVLPVSPDDMREIYEVLCCVETEAAMLLAARRPNANDIAGLETTIRKMDAALEADDLDAWANADAEYHSTLLSLCGNKRLAAIATTYQNQAHRARIFTLRLRERPVGSTDDHREQVAAILDGDVLRVQELYRAHRERAATELLGILRRFNLYSL
ncbi:MAG: GntR family transcriptional regulator [Rhodospirillales bacterium]|nr:GntR family transcriptional regulator [Rhodospirillales bacterium]